MALAPEARVAFVRPECRSDAELSREIQSLLEHEGNELSRGSTPMTPGSMVGPYRILGPIGEGGMGEVWKAHDSRLNRTVALKTSKLGFDTRFEREARAVAALNHPHICQIYDVGPDYIVMEYIAGQQLKGPLPVEKAVEYGGQILDALDAAHKKGIIHRDLKPANILLTKQGVKLLDFGLAKQSAPLTDSDATMMAGLTVQGQIMGTPQYMAPEQLQGKPADARSDLFAFGCVLYELLSGKRAFSGDSVAAVISAILEREPEPLNIPAPLDRVIRTCLAKDPDQRFQTATDLKRSLTWAMEQEPAVTQKWQHKHWPWTVAAACAVLAISVAIFPLRKITEPPLPVKLYVTPPPEGRFLIGPFTGGSAISPDGRTLAFVVTNAKGGTLLYQRPLDSLQASPLPGTEEAGRPFWSPDSKSLAFVASNKLKRIDVAGGVPITLCNTSLARGGTWNEDDVILFAEWKVGLLRIAAGGGAPEPVTKVNQAAGEQQHYYPQFLPGGKEFLYLVRHGDAAKAGIYWGSLDGKPPVQILQSEFNGLYDATAGRLLYIQGDGLLTARKLELNPPRLSGDPVIVAQGVGCGDTTGYGEFSISSNGTLFYGQGLPLRKRRFEWWDRSGKRIESVGQALELPNNDYSLSPDGSGVAFAAGLSSTDIFVMPLASGIATRLTFAGGRSARWSPDGKLVYYNNAGSIYKRAADGSGAEELLAKGLFVSSVSTDGKHLLYGRGNVFMLALEREKKSAPYLETKFNKADPVFSPDGRWVAYSSDESGRLEVYIEGFPERRGKWQVSAEGGFFPQWRADGKELYWIANDQRTVVAASMELQDAGVKAGRPELLFRANAGVLSRDGKRFLVLNPEGSEPPSLPMVVVTNWAAGLGE